MKKRFLTILTVLAILASCVAPFTAASADTYGNCTKFVYDNGWKVKSHAVAYDIPVKGGDICALEENYGLQFDITPGKRVQYNGVNYISSQIVNTDTPAVMVAATTNDNVLVLNDVYMITWFLNGGQFDPNQPKPDYWGTKLPDPLPTPQRDHATFVNWCTDKNRTIPAEPGAEITGNCTLYANWIVSMAAVTVDAIPDQKWTGKEIKPLPVVKDGGTILQKGVDYTLSYKNNTAIGQATVTITGKGSYTGTKEVRFSIVKGEPDISKIKAPSKLTKKVLVLAKKQTYTVKPVTSPDKADYSHLTFKSSDTKIAKVSKKGVVTAVKNGKCTLTITSKYNKKVKLEIKVIVGTPIGKVSLDKTKLSLKKGKTGALTAKITKNASYKTLKWSTSDKKVATVSSKGVVKAVGKGTCVITVMTCDGHAKKATCKITVK